MENEWTSVSNYIPDQHYKLFVKNSKEEVIKCYYNADGMAWRCWYGAKPVYWVDCVTGQEIENVTHWKYLNSKEKHDK